MQKQQLDKRLITRWVIVACILMVFAVFLIIQNSDNYQSIVVDGDWTISKDGIVQKDVNLIENKTGIYNKDDKLILSTKITKAIDNPMLVFCSSSSYVRVLVDNVTIYSYGKERYEADKVLGGGYHYVDLPHNYSDKNLKIYMILGENNTLVNIEEIKVVNANEYIAGSIRTNLFDITSMLIMMAVGIFVVIAAVFIGIEKKNIRRIFYIGIVSAMLGTWLICYNGFISFVSKDILFNYCLEYILLFMLPVPLMLFLYENIDGGLLKRAIKCELLINGIYIGIAVLFQCLNIMSFSKMIVIFNLIILSEVITSIIAVFLNNNGSKNTIYAMRVGVIGLASVFMLEHLVYVIKTFIGVKTVDISLAPIGGLAFVSCMILTYMFYLIDTINEIANEFALEKLAYGDTLTGLFNRKTCVDKMESLDKNNIKSFAIINFDLNWLKTINDKLGHVEGDKYLCDFSKILKECCGKDAIAGRMGGDEFIIIMENANQESVEEIIEKLNKSSGNGNKPETREIGKGVSFAYGYAISTLDKPISTQKAYELADEMMYECKKEQKVGRK